MIKRSEKSLAQRIKLICSARGFLKPKSGEKPFSEWWVQQKAEERELEEGGRGMVNTATERFMCAK
jgi:hypothetical protein